MRLLFTYAWKQHLSQVMRDEYGTSGNGYNDTIIARVIQTILRSCGIKKFTIFNTYMLY